MQTDPRKDPPRDPQRTNSGARSRIRQITDFRESTEEMNSESLPSTSKSNLKSVHSNNIDTTENIKVHQNILLKEKSIRPSVALESTITSLNKTSVESSVESELESKDELDDVPNDNCEKSGAKTEAETNEINNSKSYSKYRKSERKRKNGTFSGRSNCTNSIFQFY